MQGKESTPQSQKAPQPTWLEMGRMPLDSKGRVVIPALVRLSAFGDQDKPEVTVFLRPDGYILLKPVVRKENAG